MVAVSGHKNARGLVRPGAFSRAAPTRCPTASTRYRPEPQPAIGRLPLGGVECLPCPSACATTRSANPERRAGRRCSTWRATSTVSRTRHPALRCVPSTTWACSTAWRALNAGLITTTQFLDLNEQVGGYDQDGNYIPSRSVGDAGAIRRAYQSGLQESATGGLASIPVFDTTGDVQ